MKENGFLHIIVADFLLSKWWAGGYGLLKDYPQTPEFSRQVNDRQRRRYRISQRVPMPFIWFLRDVGVHFMKSDEELHGITVKELEFMLVRSESGRSPCIIFNDSLKSLLKGLEHQSLVRRNRELVQVGRLVAKYQNDYKYQKKKS